MKTNCVVWSNTLYTKEKVGTADFDEYLKQHKFDSNNIQYDATELGLFEFIDDVDSFGWRFVFYDKGFSFELYFPEIKESIYGYYTIKDDNPEEALIEKLVNCKNLIAVCGTFELCVETIRERCPTYRYKGIEGVVVERNDDTELVFRNSAKFIENSKLLFVPIDALSRINHEFYDEHLATIAGEDWQNEHNKGKEIVFDGNNFVYNSGEFIVTLKYTAVRTIKVNAINQSDALDKAIVIQKKDGLYDDATFFEYYID